MRSLHVSLHVADTLPLSIARAHLDVALSLLSELSDGAAADDALVHVRYHLAPVFAQHL